MYINKTMHIWSWEASFHMVIADRLDAMTSVSLWIRAARLPSIRLKYFAAAMQPITAIGAMNLLPLCRDLLSVAQVCEREWGDQNNIRTVW